MSIATDFGAVARGDSAQPRRELRSVVRDTEQRGADLEPASLEGESLAGGAGGEPGAERFVHRRGGRRAPGHQVADARRGELGGAGLGLGRHRRRANREGSARGRELDVEQVRQAPGGDVVDLVGEVLAPPAILLGEEGRIDRRIGFEQVADETAGRLRRVDQEGSGGELAPAELHRFGRLPHPDALGREQPRQPLGARRIDARNQQILPRRAAAALGDRRGAVAVVVAQDRLAVARGGDRGRERGGRVLDDAPTQSEQRAVAPTVDQAARRGLLVGHADRPLEDRPALAVAGVEGVEDLAHEVGEAVRVEAPGVVASEGVEPPALLGRDVRVGRRRRRGEEVALLAAHLVEVDGDLREVSRAPPRSGPASRAE